MSKVRRNDPCPCGSGKKYKHCCQRSLTTTKMKQMVEISRHLEGLAKFAFDNFHEDMGKKHGILSNNLMLIMSRWKHTQT